MIQLQTIYGSVKAPDWNKDLIIRTLRTYGEWAFSEQLLLAPMLRQTDVLWDVGAFLGTFGLGVAQLAARPPTRLVSVEPSSVLQPFLTENLKRNAPCPVKIVPFAVGQTSGWLRPKGGVDANAGSLAYDGTDVSYGAVPCRSLANLRAEYGDYNVLKLDVEGMENEAIRGDIPYIQESRPVIWTECNEDLSSILLLEALVWLGYEPLYVAFPFFRGKNFNRSQERIYPMAYEAVLLAAQPDRLASFTGKVEGEDIIVKPVKTSYDLRRALWATPRWSMPEWVDLTRPELVALLGRQMQKKELAEFLSDQPET
jgi:FkbM family methyltransferase